MKNYVCCFSLLFCSICCIIPTSADVYKWTDKQGKLHYGDKKPASGAEDITDRVKKQNIDSSTQEHQKLETIFRKENAADRAYRAQQAMPDPVAENHAQRCREAKNRLSAIEGRVQFIDASGKIIKTSEQERRTRAAEMRKTVADYCAP